LEPEFQLHSVAGGQDALEALRSHGPFAVVVSDMEMPGMSGVEFLARVREIAPDTVRMMLTGHADISVAMNAVNQGHIFRFLTKPCEGDALRLALATGLVQYRLVTTEKEVLENTLMGGIRVLTDVLSAVSPEAFGRSLRITRYVRYLIARFRIASPWHFETAAMLSQLGCITLDPGMLQAAYLGNTLSPEDQARFDAHPSVAQDLLSSIPRMEAVAWMIGQQLVKHISQDAPQVPALSKGAITSGARMLKVAVALDSLRIKGLSNEDALAELRSRPAEFDRQFLDALAYLKSQGTTMELRKIPILKLTAGMILQQEVKTHKGLLIVAKGQEVTPPLMARLINFSEAKMIDSEALALVPV
jgi:response regulator RpfG family c-di-GMP phosphodiesterase